MITFSTEFPVSDGKTVGDVLELGKTWLLGSPHTNLTEEDFDKKVAEGEQYERAVGSERVSIAHVDSKTYVLGGFRYCRVERSEIEWVTTIVAAKSDSQLLMSLQISCEALNTIARLPKPNKPYIIKQVLELLGGGMDGDVPVADKPFYLAASEVDAAAELISGKAGNRLPLIYVSSRYNGTHSVDPAELARWTAGLAHVVVEPSRSFSAALKDRVDGRNTYGGAIGVYWPASNARKVYPVPAGAAAKQLQFEIARHIRVTLANRRQTSHCTWLHLQEVLASQRLERIRQSGSSELREFMDAFDAEIRAKDQRIAEAEAEIRSLNMEVGRYASVANATKSLLSTGAEQDMYADEIQDTVVAALEQYVSMTLEASRKNHIASDLLAHNPKSGNAHGIDEELKAIFRTYTDMDAKTRGRLARLGFDLTEEGKHYKAVYQGDGRYTFAISKTSSDHRAGKNLASDISKAIL